MGKETQPLPLNPDNKLRALRFFLLATGIAYLLLPDLFPGPVDDALVFLGTLAIRIGLEMFEKNRVKNLKIR